VPQNIRSSNRGKFSAPGHPVSSVATAIVAADDDVFPPARTQVRAAEKFARKILRPRTNLRKCHGRR
jgi:hypothetical protein